MFLSLFFLFLIIAICSTFNYAVANPILFSPDQQAMPDDFKDYFYHSEIPVQVYLNDKILFDADMTLTEAGTITLVRLTSKNESVYDSADIHRWEDSLLQGIQLGKCEDHCPSGLMAAEYSLSASSLKLYSKEYEKEKTQSRYLAMPTGTPAGLIISNDFNYSGGQNASHRSRLNSSWISSLMGWSQKLSFQSAAYNTQGSAENTINLYEFYTQKEWQGHFLRFGYFTPSSAAGNVQTGGFGNERTLGMMWTSSDNLLADYDNVSLYPIYVTGRNAAIAEVYRDNRLIYSQQLQAGIQPLNTLRLPAGIYDIRIDIIENGKKTDSQRAQVYKPIRWKDNSKRWRYNLWFGQLQPLSSSRGSQDKEGIALGGSADFLLHPRVILGAALAQKGQRQDVSARTEIMLNNQNALYAQISANSERRISTDLRYYQRYSQGSIGLHWRRINTPDGKQGNNKNANKESWAITLNQNLTRHSSMMLRGQYISAGSQPGLAADIGINTSVRIVGRDVSLRFVGYDRPRYSSYQGRDRGIELGLSFSLDKTLKTHSIAAQLGLKNDNPYTNLHYQWRPEHPAPFSYANTTVSADPDGLSLSGNLGVDTPLINGDVYLQRGAKTTDLYGGANLSNILVFGGNSIAAGRQLDAQAALILEVESDQKDLKLEISGAEASSPFLQTGKNIVSVMPWQEKLLQFSAPSGEGIKIYPENYTLRMNRGSVNYLKLRAVKTETVVGMLTDENGELLYNQEISSDVGKARINSDGVFTLEVNAANPKITLTGQGDQPGLICPLAPAPFAEKGKVRFVDTLACHRSR